MTGRAMMMLACIVMVQGLTIADGKSGLNDATVRFKVVDDNGNPVTNANIFACSLSNHKGVGNTDTNGLFSYVARSVYSIMYCNIVKEEYYRTKGDAWHWKNWGEVPTNTLPVVMKRIINPVPMLKKSAVLYFPKLEEPVGFDFEVGDWVAPYGKGRCSDVWMTGQWIDVNADQFDLHASITASNACDGFIEYPLIRGTDSINVKSDLQPPHAMPETGYTNQVEIYRVAVPGKPRRDSSDKNVDYLFRFRCRTNELGQVTHANVGWFENSITVTKSEKKQLRIRLEYYYNPDPLSRSLEPKEIADLQKIWMRDVEKRQKKEKITPE